MSESLRNLEPAARAALLRRASSFAELDDGAIAALAAATVVRHFPYKTVLTRIGESPRGRPLRLVALGSILVQTPGLDDSRRCVGPGMLLGEEGAVVFAVDRGLILPPRAAALDYYAYAAEDTWALELPADRFEALFAGGQQPALLEALRAVAWRAARAPELVAMLRRTPELARATDDDLHALLEGGRLQRFPGGAELTPQSAVAVVSGGMLMLENGREERLGPGAVVGQRDILLGHQRHADLQLTDDAAETVILALPRDRYESVLCARPELTAAIARAMPELALPAYPTEVALLLAAAPLQRRLPLAKLTDALAQTIHAHLGDAVLVVRVVWDDAPPEPAPPDTATIEVPRGPPATIAAAVRDGLHAILQRSWRTTDVVLVDPSALHPDLPTERALVVGVTDVSAPTRLSYMFSRPGEWSRVFDVVGERVDALTLLPTVVLPARPPALDAIREGLSSRHDEPPARGLKSLPTFLRHRLRTIGDRLAVQPRIGVVDTTRTSSSSTSPQVWPKTAVRLRLSEPGRQAAQLPDDDSESMRRWARAITGRRVGVALGGAGALSYLCIPLLRGLRTAGVPIDIISGTSFGAVVGAYYAALGDRGLDLVIRHWYWAQITVAWGWLSTVPLQAWLNFDLGGVDISQLDTPLIPVATNAANGREWDQRAGVVGHVCAASGSLPPLAPTYEGNVRLLDGALSADTPNRVLGESGARLVIGANPIPAPWPEPDIPLPIPVLGELLRTLNPVTRMTDAVRGFGMLFRQAAQSQERWADVTYLADPTFGNGATFFLRHAFIEQGDRSPSLRTALALARTRWSELLTRPRRPDRTPPTTTTAAAD